MENFVTVQTKDIISSKCKEKKQKEEEAKCLKTKF